MSAADTITITGLQVFAHHGVYETERKNGQNFIIDAKLRLNYRAADPQDDLSGTVNYASIVEALADEVAGTPAALIETVAERAATRCLAFTGVASVTVTVHKPEAPLSHTVQDVCVTITRP